MSVPIVPIAATYQKLRDENERLREALEQILEIVIKIGNATDGRGSEESVGGACR